jgi:hypothetical protein
MVYVATGELNLQTKLAAVGLPYLEPDLVTLELPQNMCPHMPMSGWPYRLPAKAPIDPKD